MQFSIFGVPFKCTVDMFTRQKFKWTFFILISFLFSVFLASLVITGGGYLFDLLKSSLRGTVTVGGLAKEVAVMILTAAAAIYLLHDNTYNQKFQSFDRKYETLSGAPKLFSWAFAKVYLITWVIGATIGAVVGFIVGFLGGILQIDDTGIYVAIISAGILIQFMSAHIFLHGGTWGFVPVEKQPAVITN